MQLRIGPAVKLSSHRALDLSHLSLGLPLSNMVCLQVVIVSLLHGDDLKLYHFCFFSTQLTSHGDDSGNMIT